ncbi:MAG: GNAT family N-acetyltransferase [Anaerolineae bacterium]|nr:GNAT family N-acetyltransferase [Anaerolineae bacterium]
MNIRDFTPGDYQAIVDVQKALYPTMPTTVAGFVEADERRDAKCKNRKWIAEHDGVVVGWAFYGQHLWEYDPQRFRVGASVHPDHQGRGIGKALYDVVVTALEPFNPNDLRTRAREDHPQAMRFALQRGFVEFLRQQRSELALAGFEPAPFADVLAQVADRGVAIKSMTALADAPDHDAKVHALDMLVSPDEPGLDDFTPLTLEQYQREIIGAPTFAHDGSFIAINADGEYVGLTFLWNARGTDTLLFTGFTAVRRDHRRQRIASALKVHALTWAKANGKTRIITGNADTNPMLQLNYRLGFRPTPGWVSFKKQVPEAQEQQS